MLVRLVTHNFSSFFTVLLSAVVCGRFLLMLLCCLQMIPGELYGPLMLVFTLITLLLFGMKTSGHTVVSGFVSPRSPLSFKKYLVNQAQCSQVCLALKAEHAYSTAGLRDTAPVAAATRGLATYAARLLSGAGSVKASMSLQQLCQEL